MPAKQNQSLYHSLRKKYPFFSFDDFIIIKSADQLQIKYRFNLSDAFIFEPTITIPAKPFINLSINEDLLENLAFNIGMVELISYWKAACPPQVIINAAYLDNLQVEWFKKLYFNGLSEFFYVNGIAADFDDFMQIKVRGDWDYPPVDYQSADSVLVPVGGGKDSAVTLDLVKNAGFNVIPFILNPRKASLETTQAAGFEEDHIFTVHRTIDKTLLQLNDQGFLNGHTPFSALLAFVTLLAGAMTNCQYVALSNESSANEPTIPGTTINHQYSKSVDFEREFRGYAERYISKNIEYFSLFRPLNELQIGKIFSKLTHQFQHFKSCNAGSKTDSWCCKCSKCLFTWIILSPFINQKELVQIFGNDLWEDETLLPIFQQLTGIADEKPFECVGTIDEVNTALVMTIRNYQTVPLPFLLRYYSSTRNFAQFSEGSHKFLMENFENENYVPDQFLKILKMAIG